MIASNQTFIVAAYAVTWIVLIGYLLRVARAGRRARAALERALAAAGSTQ
jgi:hypothetical protein